MFWATHPTMTISEEEKKEKNKSLLEAEGRFSYWTKVDTINTVFMLFHLWSQPPKPPPLQHDLRVAQLARLQ